MFCYFHRHCETCRNPRVLFGYAPRKSGGIVPHIANKDSLIVLIGIDMVNGLRVGWKFVLCGYVSGVCVCVCVYLAVEHWRYCYEFGWTLLVMVMCCW